MSNTLSINQLLSLMRVVRERLVKLRELRSEVSTRDTWMGKTEKIIEPQYSVIEVDKKIVELELFLYQADAAIKQSNAITKIEGLEPDVEKLLAPLQ